jgi:hypothetical protein
LEKGVVQKKEEPVLIVVEGRAMEPKLDLKEPVS